MDNQHIDTSKQYYDGKSEHSNKNTESEDKLVLIGCLNIQDEIYRLESLITTIDGFYNESASKGIHDALISLNLANDTLKKIVADMPSKPQTAVISDKLVTDVIDNIREAINADDVDALDELLKFVPKENLVGFLPENKHNEYEEFREDCSV